MSLRNLTGAIALACTASSSSTRAAAEAPSAPASHDQLVLTLIDIGEGIALLAMLAVAASCLWMGFGFLRQAKLFQVPAEKFLFRRHWGGFGGDSSGWQISPSLATGLLGLMLVTFGVTLTSASLFVLHQHTITETKDESKADALAAKPADSAATAATAAAAANHLKSVAAAPTAPTGAAETEEPAAKPKEAR